MDEEPTSEDHPVLSVEPDGAVRSGAEGRADAEPPDTADAVCSAALCTHVAEAIQSLSLRFESEAAHVVRLFEDKLAWDATKERQVLVMSEQLERYRQDVVWKTSEPLVRGAIRLLRNTRAAAARVIRESEPAAQAHLALKELKNLTLDIEDLLSDFNVTSYEVEGETFDATRQQVAKTVDSDDAMLRNRVVEKVFPGFATPERIVEKERVAVWTVRLSRSSAPDAPEMADSPLPARVSSERENQ